MPYPAIVEPKLVERAQKLKLMGFDSTETKGILEAEFEITITDSERQKLMGMVNDALSQLPGLDAVKSELGAHWAQQTLFQADFLAIYQTLVRNYNAYVAGHLTHADGSPVVPVKVSDLVSVSNHILSMGEKRVTSQLNSLKMLPALENDGDGSSGVTHILSELVDDDDFSAS